MVQVSAARRVGQVDLVPDLLLTNLARVRPDLETLVLHAIQPSEIQRSEIQRSVAPAVLEPMVLEPMVPVDSVAVVSVAVVLVAVVLVAVVLVAVVHLSSEEVGRVAPVARPALAQVPTQEQE